MTKQIQNNPHLKERYQFLRQKVTLEDIKKWYKTNTPEFGIIYRKYGEKNTGFRISKTLASKLRFILSQSNELHIKVEVEPTNNKEFKNKMAVFFNFNNLNQFKLFFSGRKLIKNDSVKNRRFWYYLFITNEPFEISEKFYNFLAKNVRLKYHENN
jgi:hypothetical protein